MNSAHAQASTSAAHPTIIDTNNSKENEIKLAIIAALDVPNVINEALVELNSRAGDKLNHIIIQSKAPKAKKNSVHSTDFTKVISDRDRLLDQSTKSQNKHGQVIKDT